MGRFEPQRGEVVRLRLTPHPLSVLGRYAIPLFLMFWGSLFFLLSGAGPFETPRSLLSIFATSGPARVAEQWIIFALPIGVAAILLWRIGHATLLSGVMIIALATATFMAVTYPPFSSTLGITTMALGLLGVAIADLSRRSMVYVVTSKRMILRQGLLLTLEKMTRLQNVSELESSQTPLGRLFDFGDIIPAVKPEDPADRPRTRRTKGKKEEPPQWRIRGAHPFIRSREAIFAIISDRVHQDYEQEAATRAEKEEKKGQDLDTLARLDELLQPGKRQDE